MRLLLLLVAQEEVHITGLFDSEYVALATRSGFLYTFWTTDGWRFFATTTTGWRWMVPPTPTPHRWMAAESTTQLIRIHSRIQVSPVIVLDVDDGCGGENGKLSAAAGIRMYPDTPASGK